MRAPTHLLVALDAPGGCPSRREILPSYKSARSTPPVEFTSQALELAVVLHEAGIPTMAVPEWEADDIVASAAHAAAAAGLECEIFSADRDVYQLLTDQVRVVRVDGSVVTDVDIRRKYGVSPQQYVELAAMRGEVADCIEGVPRIGEKTAQKILAAFGSVQAAISSDQLDEVVAVAAARNLREYAERVDINIRVATLKTDLPVQVDTLRLPLDGSRLTAALTRAGLPAAASALRNACGA